MNQIASVLMCLATITVRVSGAKGQATRAFLSTRNPDNEIFAGQHAPVASKPDKSDSEASDETLLKQPIISALPSDHVTKASISTRNPDNEGANDQHSTSEYSRFSVKPESDSNSMYERQLEIGSDEKSRYNDIVQHVKSLMNIENRMDDSYDRYLFYELSEKYFKDNVTNGGCICAIKQDLWIQNLILRVIYSIKLNDWTTGNEDWPWIIPTETTWSNNYRECSLLNKARIILIVYIRLNMVSRLFNVINEITQQGPQLSINLIFKQIIQLTMLDLPGYILDVIGFNKINITKSEDLSRFVELARESLVVKLVKRNEVASFIQNIDVIISNKNLFYINNPKIRRSVMTTYQEFSQNVRMLLEKPKPKYSIQYEHMPRGSDNELKKESARVKLKYYTEIGEGPTILTADKRGTMRLSETNIRMSNEIENWLEEQLDKKGILPRLWSYITSGDEGSKLRPVQVYHVADIGKDRLWKEFETDDYDIVGIPCVRDTENPDFVKTKLKSSGTIVIVTKKKDNFPKLLDEKFMAFDSSVIYIDKLMWWIIPIMGVIPKDPLPKHSKKDGIEYFDTTTYFTKDDIKTENERMKGLFIIVTELCKKPNEANVELPQNLELYKEDAVSESIRNFIITMIIFGRQVLYSLHFLNNFLICIDLSVRTRSDAILYWVDNIFKPMISTIPDDELQKCIRQVLVEEVDITAVVKKLGADEVDIEGSGTTKIGYRNQSPDSVKEGTFPLVKRIIWNFCYHVYELAQTRYVDNDPELPDKPDIHLEAIINTYNEIFPQQ